MQAKRLCQRGCNMKMQALSNAFKETCMNGVLTPILITHVGVLVHMRMLCHIPSLCQGSQVPKPGQRHTTSTAKPM